MTNQRTRGRRNRDDDVIDLRGVEAGGGRRSAHLPEEDGPYWFQIAEVTREVGEESGKAYLNARLKVDRGEYKGKVIYHNLSLQSQALFNLRGMMEACGLEAEKSFSSAALIKLLTGKKFQAEVADDVYNNKTKSVIDSYVVESSDDEDEDDEEEDEEEEPPARSRRAKAPAAKAKAKAKAPAAKAKSRRSRDEEDEDEDDEDIDDIDLDDI